MNQVKGTVHILLILISASISASILIPAMANPAPNTNPDSGPLATATFGTNPIYTPGIKPTMIVDEFGVIDSSLTQQKQDEYKKKISEWSDAGIDYGAYYNLTNIESDLRYSLSAGAQINPDGTPVTGDNAGQTFYHMSPTRQGFKDYLINSGKLAIDLGVSHLFLDVASIDFRTLSFDDEIVSAFSAYINEPGYDIRTLLIAAGYTKTNQNIDVNNAVLTADAHWAQWTQYDKIIEQEFFTLWTTELKNYATSKGQTIQLSANRYINGAEPADTWVTGNLLDYTLAETFLDTLGYPEKDLNYAYKTSVAFGKRFWSWNFPNNTDSLDDGIINSSDNQPVNNADRLFVAQTFANGGLSQVGGAGWVNFIAHDIKPDITKPDYQFVQSHPELFNLSEASEIAILYGEYAVNSDPGGLGESFKGASYLLSDAHRLWDVVFAADENRAGFTADLLTLAKLNEYKTILIPHVQQLSDAQVAIIESYLADPTHTVIGFSTVATHSVINTINTDVSATRTFDNLFVTDAVDTTSYAGTVISFLNDLGKSTADNATTAATRAANVTSFNSVVTPIIPAEISTTLPPTIQITRFKDDTDGSHIYHLVNTDYTIVTDTINPVASGATLSVSVPPGYVGDINISIMTPENSTGTTTVLTPTAGVVDIALPGINVWTIIKVGSTALTAAIIDNYPWSQFHFRDSVSTTTDDAFNFNGSRPDTLNASGDFEFDYRYWKNSAVLDDPSVGAFNFNIAYLATDDVGISQLELYYRYSAEYNVWTSWYLAGTDTSGTNGIGILNIKKTPYGDGHYQFYTKVTDTNGQVEHTISGPETGYGIDTTAPGAPPSFSETGGALNSVWQTTITDPQFSWATPVDILSGSKEAWLNIDNIADGSTLASCNNIDLKTTNSINPSTCTTPLNTLSDGRYRVRFRASDTAANISDDYNIFEIRIGTKTVQDPINGEALAQNGTVFVHWNPPADTTNFNAITAYLSPVNTPETIWKFSKNITISNPASDNSMTITGLVNGTQYRIALEAFDMNNNLPGDLVKLTNNVTPLAFEYGVTLTPSVTPFSLLEGGTAKNYSVVLNAPPMSDVVVSISSDTQVSATPTTVTFTPNNWNEPQSINVIAIDDNIEMTTPDQTVSHAFSSTDANYNNLTLANISISVTDNDASPVDPISDTIPGVDLIADPPIDTGTTTGTPATTSSNSSSGGCTIARTISNTTNNSTRSVESSRKIPIDPMLPILLLISIYSLINRKEVNDSADKIN